MRYYLIVAIFAAIALGGCESCERIDDFGKCSDSGRCNRPHISINWKMLPEENSQFNSESLEKIDVVFVWSEVYEKLTELHRIYASRIEEVPDWCKSYSNCQVSNQDWESYWMTMTQTATKLLQVKTILCRRLGYLHLNAVTAQDKATIEAMSQHLQRHIKVYHIDLLKVTNNIDKYLSKNIPRREFANAVDQFEQLLKTEWKFSETDMEREVLKDIEWGSEHLTQHLKNTVQTVQKLPNKK